MSSTIILFETDINLSGPLKQTCINLYEKFERAVSNKSLIPLLIIKDDS